MSRTYDELRSPRLAREAGRPEHAPLYFSTRRTARVLGCVFVLAAAIGWVAAGYDLGELRAIARRRGARRRPRCSRTTRPASGSRSRRSRARCCVAAVFVPWLHQARANVRALGARRLRFGREWTYLAFAIPVLNAYRPYQVVSEVWRGSDPASIDPLGWQRLPTSRLVLAWWVGLVGWVAFALLAALLLRIAPGHRSTSRSPTRSRSRATWAPP